MWKIWRYISRHSTISPTMQKLILALLALFGIGLVFVLHEHAQNGRYLTDPQGRFVTDTRTGAIYSCDTQTGGLAPHLSSAPIAR